MACARLAKLLYVCCLVDVFQIICQSLPFTCVQLWECFTLACLLHRFNTAPAATMLNKWRAEYKKKTCKQPGQYLQWGCYSTLPCCLLSWCKVYRKTRFISTRKKHCMSLKDNTFRRHSKVLYSCTISHIILHTCARARVQTDIYITRHKRIVRKMFSNNS